MLICRAEKAESLTYATAGVDIDAGNELVRRIQKLNPQIGGFSGLVPFGETTPCPFLFLQRLLVADGAMQAEARVQQASRGAEGCCVQGTPTWWQAPTGWARS